MRSATSFLGRRLSGLSQFGSVLKNVAKQAAAFGMLMLVASLMVSAQGGSGKGQGAGNQASQGAGAPSGGGSLPGLTWAQDSWSTELKGSLKDVPNKRVVCFRLVYTFSAAQPFALERITPPFTLGGESCDKLDEKNPLMMRERLVIGIDTSAIADLSRLRILNLNLTNQQGNPINPTPIRPSFAGGAPSGGATTAAVPRGPFLLVWPDRLPGDVIPTISVNTIYTPVMPAATWADHTFYPVGSITVPSTLNGHYYTATSSGISFTKEPKSWVTTTVAEVSESGGPALTWTDETPLPLPQECQSPIKVWQPATVYSSGSCVKSRNSHLWVSSHSGTSATGTEPFPLVSVPGNTVKEKTGISWTDKTPVPAKCGSAVPWKPRQPYANGACVLSRSSRFWMAVQGGTSDDAEPFPPVSAAGNSIAEKNGVKWVDKTPPMASPAQCGASPKAWQPNSIVQAGTCVSSSSARLWLAIIGGVSGTNAEPFPQISEAGDTVEERTTLMWADSGTSPPAGPAKKWLPGTPHIVGDVVLDPVSGHFYTAIEGGVSGAASPTFPVTQSATFSENPLLREVADNSVVWSYFGTSAARREPSKVYPHGATVFSSTNSHYYVAIQSDPVPLKLALLGKSSADPHFEPSGDTSVDGTVTWKDVGSDPTAIAWQKDTDYWQDTVVYSKRKQLFYIATSRGKQRSQARDEEPDFPNDKGFPSVSWQDSGSTAPSAVAGGQPADQTINLLNLTLPQTHVISIYNLSAGVVYSSIKTPTFSVSGGATVQTGSSHTVDPVLMLTAYWFGHWFPMDAERDWRPRDLTPGLSVGFSLTSPASNFYFGGSSEFFLRNVQLVYGVSEAKVSAATSGSNGSSPATTQHFHTGWYTGLTFNVSGFIQGLFGGGGGGKSSGP